jgi:hypothetical protein
MKKMIGFGGDYFGRDIFSYYGSRNGQQVWRD